MQFSIHKLDVTRREDFFKLHGAHDAGGECFCTAWWVTTWQEWSERTAEQNRELRRRLFDDNIFDGYLLYDGEEPVGWCQCCRRDMLPKIGQTYRLAPDSDTWSISCFFILPQYREIGLAHYFLNRIIEDLEAQGVNHLQGFPKRGEKLAAEDLWTGPESIFIKAGFRLEQDDESHPMYGLILGRRGKK
jgi:GNAT superfamily N-acetyltransferase